MADGTGSTKLEIGKVITQYSTGIAPRYCSPRCSAAILTCRWSTPRTIQVNSVHSSPTVIAESEQKKSRKSGHTSEVEWATCHYGGTALQRGSRPDIRRG